MEPALFNNIPSEDRMQLFSKGEPEGSKIAEFLKYKKQDVASATGIPLASIRYDIKMPAELRARLVEWAMALNLVAEYFNDVEKAALWFQVPNPHLGNMTHSLASASNRSARLPRPDTSSPERPRIRSTRRSSGGMTTAGPVTSSSRSRPCTRYAPPTGATPSSRSWGTTVRARAPAA